MNQFHGKEKYGYTNEKISEAGNRGKKLRKRWLMAGMAVGLLCALLQTPEYWSVFQTDEAEYEKESFYGWIKGEYRQGEDGEKQNLQRFSDLEDGDILVTDSAYCFCYRHGHAALVIDAAEGITLEAFGIGRVSEFSSISEWKKYPHVLVLRLRAEKELRAAVAQYAKMQLVGIPYRLSAGLYGEKYTGEEYKGTQCAHLIWLAYKKFGYDIDGNSGWLVAPEDFVKSPLLEQIVQ